MSTAHTEMVHLRMPPEMLADVRERASREGYKVAEFLRAAVRRELKEGAS